MSSQMEGYTGQCLGKVRQLPCSVQVPDSPSLCMFTSLEALRILSFWAFLGGVRGGLHYVGMIL